MRKGMAYGRMREIDRMSTEAFSQLPEEERALWWRTPMPPMTVRDILLAIAERERRISQISFAGTFRAKRG